MERDDMGKELPQLSLFFFDGTDEPTSDTYRLLRDATDIAERAGFEAVWIPERHFGRFGAPFPNPAILAASLATTTTSIKIRGGSVVLPLHNVIRVAEEWAVVDKLSGGRAGLAAASGFHPRDFALAPDRFKDRRECMTDQLVELRDIWQQGIAYRSTGDGSEQRIDIYPRPIQAELPLWITAGGNRDESFVQAAQNRMNVLTALIFQDEEDLVRRVALYEEQLATAGLQRDDFCVTLMLHTYVSDSDREIEKIVVPALSTYLRSHIELAAGPATGQDEMSPAAIDSLVRYGVDRYVNRCGLIGSPDQVADTLARFKAHGVDEVACLVDFGVPTDDALASLHRLTGIVGEQVRPQAGTVAR